MGSNFNFRNFGTDLSGEMANGETLPGNIPLTRQSSVYSLTFDEFQSAVGGIGKDLGSMNMDELLKNIWTAEENQNIGSSSGGYGVVQEGGGGYLQRQGSLTLPRTLSQKTVDEVWNDISKEYYDGGKDAVGNMSGFNMPQKEKTLGEITLEEFLVRAGVVREEAQLAVKASNDCFSSELSSDVNNSWLAFGYHHQQQQQQARGGNAGLANGNITERSNHTAKPSANLPLNVNGARAAARQLGAQQHSAQLVQPQQQPQILPKQPTVAYGAAMEIPNGQLGNSGMRGDTVGIQDPAISRSMVQNATSQGGGMGIPGFGTNGVTAAVGSPAVSSDGLTSNGDTSSVSPVPYVFSGSVRGRRSAALEKVVERRQRRMIKNRESAARSRARKQAYTMELEAEVAKLKEENELLQKKQDEMMEMQKNQALEMMNQQSASKRRCLRRTQTGPW